MFIVTAIVTALFAALLLVSARGKLTHDAQQVATMTKVRFPEDKLWLLATAEIAGAAGLVVGLLWWPLGVVAAACLIAYFLGATVAHLRVGDRQVTAPAALMVVAAAALVLRAVSA
jgi:uncharacterized membrane protein YphA (DoxX/SURF4 family)